MTTRIKVGIVGSRKYTVKRKIKDYHVNNHFKQSLKMSWYEIMDCPDCKWFERHKEDEHSRLHKPT